MTESGGGYTWVGEQPREQADALVERSGHRRAGRSLYLRDDRQRSNLVAPAGVRAKLLASGEIHHGQGYTRFLTPSAGDRADVTGLDCRRDPVKFDPGQRCRITAASGGHFRSRTIAEWVLGVHRDQTQLHVVTDLRPSGVLIARNAYHPELPRQVPFCKCSDPIAVGPATARNSSAATAI